MNKCLGKVTLDTANHIMTPRFSALANDSERVILHDGCPTDPAQETLLYPAIEPKNGDFGRWLSPFIS